MLGNVMIVVATKEEKEFIESKYGERKEILVTGVGAINVYESLKKISRETPILNLGFAGSPNIPIGTLVSVGNVRLYHPNVTYDEREYLLCGSIPCYTSCDFVIETRERDCVFDMELAYILSMGFSNVRSYKVVSDNLSTREYEKNSKSRKNKLTLPHRRSV